MNLKEHFRNNILNITDISEVIRSANKYEVNFFAFRFPGESVGYFGASKRLSSDIKTTGFLIAPFQQNENLNKIIIPNDYCNDLPSNLAIKDIDNDLIPQKSTNEQYYLKTTQELIDELNKEEVESKVVISKVIVNKSNTDVANLFSVLCSTYNNAFVFCYYTKVTGLWIGASPEQLLSVDEKIITSMSLAGTRKTNTKEEWSHKNINEQQIVTDYISTIFKKHGYFPEISERFTKNAGPVEHICTIIKANKTNSSAPLHELIDELSPTPALAGYPKSYALKKIALIERHDRKCYGGYMGPISTDDTLSFFVNLRSIHIEKSYYTLYAGGGITKESIAIDEWKETEIKASTLLNLIDKCKLTN